MCCLDNSLQPGFRAGQDPLALGGDPASAETVGADAPVMGEGTWGAGQARGRGPSLAFCQQLCLQQLHFLGDKGSHVSISSAPQNLNSSLFGGTPLDLFLNTMTSSSHCDDRVPDWSYLF